MASNPATTAGIRREAQEDLAKVRDKLEIDVNPALVEHARQRADNVQNRIADRITAFAGSMMFVYLHIIWFTVWIASGVEHYPYGLLTMIVSLEAIFLSCFVLISQNRQAEKDRVRSDIEYDVNIKAELEIAHLHEKTDRMYSEMLEYFTRIEKRLANPSAPVR
jgi:uncharacterized membrane protein